MGKIFAGDVGTDIRIDLQEDLTNAVVKLLKVKKPVGTEVEWTPTLIANSNGLMSVLKYITSEGDLSVRGVYRIQPYIEFSAWKGSCESVRLDVAGSFQ